MNKRHYSGSYVRRKKKRPSGGYSCGQKENSYFFVKANICLGIVICTLAAASMESEKISGACDRLAEMVTGSVTGEELKNSGEDILSFIKNGENGVYTFAGEKEKITLDQEILDEIESRSGVYEKNNKGAPQKTGLSQQQGS